MIKKIKKTRGSDGYYKLDISDIYYCYHYFIGYRPVVPKGQVRLALERTRNCVSLNRGIILCAVDNINKFVISIYRMV